MLKHLAVFISILICLYAALIAVLYIYQEKLIFPAQVLPDNYRFSFDVPYEEFMIPVPGAQLNALHFPQPDPQGVVFFLHGNAGNLATWTTGLDFYKRINYDLFIFDYRGYGKSSGRIENQAQLFADVRAAWDFIIPRYQNKNIVIYGRSLGTGLAVELAQHVNTDLLVLVSPYKSLLAMAKRQYAWIPNWVMRYPLRSDEMIAQVRSNIFFMHGENDELIPPQDSQALQRLTSTSSELLIVPRAMHNDIHQFPDYLNGLANAVQSLCTQSGTHIRSNNACK